MANIRNNNKNSFNKTEDINKTNKVDCIEDKNASVFYDENQKELSKSSSIDSANDSKTASKVEDKNVNATTLNDDDKKAILDQLNKVQESSQNSSYAKTGKASANTSKNSSQTPLTTLYGDSEEVVYLNNTEKEDESADEKLKDDFKKELNKKANKEKKVKPRSSKKSFKQRMKTLGILTVLGVFTGCGLGVWYFNNAVVPPVNYGLYNASDYQTSAEDVLGELFRISSDYENWRSSSEFLSSGIDSPSDLTPVQNFLLAEYNAMNSDYFHIVGSGKVNVSAFGLPISQTVYSEKNFDGNTYTFESISEGTKDIGKCSVMKKSTSLNPNPEVMLFSSSDVYTSEGASITDNAVWNKYDTYTQEAYIDLAGGLPNGIQTYIISDKTITSTNDSSVITYDEATGYYTFTIELDPITSVLNYVRQVQQTSGLGSAPTFESVKQTITIDGEWNLISISIEERYSVLYGGISAGCSGTLTSYYYLNQPELIDFPDLPIGLENPEIPEEPENNVDYSQYDASDYQTKAEDVLGELFGISSDYENWRSSSEFLSSGIDSPSDLTPVQNFLLAEFNALNSDYFHIVGNGRVRVSAFGIPISQTVYSEKNYDGNTYTFESISEGTMDIGKCSVMEKPTSLNSNPEVMLFSSSDVYTSEGASITDNAVWNKYDTYTQEAYIDLAGGLPNGIQTYIISDKTITSTNDSSVITYDEETGYYTFTIELDPITSVLNYVRQVQQTSGLGSPPTFESVKQTITIDGEWNLISISIEERYSVLYGGISAGCSGTLTSYYYLNQPELIDFPDLPIEL